MTPEERAAETFQAMLMSGSMMTKLSGDVKLCQIIAQAIREAEAARDERAAKIVEAMGKRRHMNLIIHGYGSEKPVGTKEDLGIDYVDEPHKTIAAAIRSPDML